MSFNRGRPPRIQKIGDKVLMIKKLMRMGKYGRIVSVPFEWLVRNGKPDEISMEITENGQALVMRPYRK